MIKQILKIAGIFLLFNLIGDVASAATPGDEAAEAITTGGFGLLITIQQVLNKLIWPVLFMIGGLLENDILFGSGMEERMRDIWVPIRNLVNILFVIALVGVAIYNILGIGEEGDEYSVKTMLPKIVVGIIAINFSFFGIKVFLDGVSVFTGAIFDLPDNVSQGLGTIYNPGSPEDQQKINRLCKALEGTNVSSLQGAATAAGGESLGEAITVGGAGRATSAGTTASTGLVDSAARYAYLKSGGTIPPSVGGSTLSAIDFDNLAKSFPVDKIVAYENYKSEFLNNRFCDEINAAGDYGLTAQGQLFLSKYGSQNAAFALALNMSQIVFFNDIPADVQDIEGLIVSSFFSIILYLILFISFLALFVVLLARLVVLWVGIVLSPVILLGIAVPAIKEKVESLGEIADKFLQNALAPIGIALSLTIGWIMLNGLQGVGNLSEADAVVGNILKNPSLGAPIVNLETLQELIVCTGTIAVVWLGVFSAMSKTVASPVTDYIKGAVEGAGSWVATAPFKYAPIIPVTLPQAGGGTAVENVSVANIFDAANQAKYQLQGGGKNKISDALGYNPISTPAAFAGARDATAAHNLVKEAIYGNNLTKDMIKALSTEARSAINLGTTPTDRILQRMIKKADDPKSTEEDLDKYEKEYKITKDYIDFDKLKHSATPPASSPTPPTSSGSPPPPPTTPSKLATAKTELDGAIALTSTIAFDAAGNLTVTPVAPPGGTATPIPAGKDSQKAIQDSVQKTMTIAGLKTGAGGDTITVDDMTQGMDDAGKQQFIDKLASINHPTLSLVTSKKDRANAILKMAAGGSLESAILGAPMDISTFTD